MKVSKINAIRFINLNYNYNAISVDDETFYIDGENTLLSLRNGGGKSVLVQMLIAPFVNKRYRNSNKREFSSYFTTNKPTFILVEWKLDGNSGYVLTGMMVRKSQEIKEDQSQGDLDIFQFIHEYKERNQYDIHNIPFIKTIDDSKRLIKYSDCKELLESVKQDKNYKFFLYDMNNRSTSKNYFDKLEEYQIYHKEWESIVKKINIKESGLSELFTNAKDEAGLIEGWFLPTVEDKLNKGKNRIEEFRDILGRYIKQYKENKSKIDQKNIILIFKEETQTVLDMAENLKATTEDKSIIENKIANLIVKLKNLNEKLELDRISLEEKETILNDEIRRIEYEEISLEIYGFKDDGIGLVNERSQVIEQISKNEEVNKTLVKRKNIQECAKIHKQYQNASRDVQEFENKLELLEEKDKDRAPERDLLGYSLRYFYENEKQIIETQIKMLEEAINQTKEKNKTLEDELDILNGKEKDGIRNLSEINTNINNFDKLEKRFNEQYNEKLRRNILDEYEDSSLDIKLKDIKISIERLGLELVRSKNTSQHNDEKLKTYKRQIEDKSNDLATVSQEIISIDEKVRNLGSEIGIRKSIIKHIGFGEDKIFDTDEILKEFQRKKDEVQVSLKSLEINLRDLEEEYNKLQSGKVLELSEDIKEALDLEDINYIYGMEWLKRNNKSLIENQTIIKNNPFIPYSLVLTKKDTERLKSQNLGIYTSFPIPIVIRESLEEQFDDNKSSIHLGYKVNFYVLFNENLLDENELNRILVAKEEEILNLNTALEIREGDLNQYNEKYNTIKYQILNEKSYRDIQKLLISKQKMKKDYNNDLNILRDEEQKLVNSQEQLERTINKNEKQLDEFKRKDIALFNLNREYVDYLSIRNDRIKIKNNLSNIEAEIKFIKDEINKLADIHQGAKDSRREYLNKLESTEIKLQEYSRYDKRELVQKDIEDIEARYKALTNEITTELKDIEESLSKARGRFNEHEKDLTDTSNRLSIDEEEYKNETYDSFNLETIECDISDITIELSKLNSKHSDLSVEIAVRDNEISQSFKRLKEKLDETELIPRNQIIVTEFKKRIMDKKDDLNKLKSDLNGVINKMGYYNNNLSSLAEYYELPLVEVINFDESLSSFGREALDKFRGIMLRDYRQINENINKLVNELSVALDKLLRSKSFQDDFFNRPLNTLLTLKNDPVEFIEQLSITLKAYDDLMAKLEVDIALVDKEKERVIEILLEYISDIHRNLDKIDKNSTIKIREKPIKMLRVDLPDWETEENQYRNKLKDMVESLTQSGIKRLEENENIEEIISPMITTKNLYNTVVGINNISIKLYKIEAERQRQIDWSEVSKNSGGEGFLSAFVILSSLLSFMRRDETDVFAELEESKVLIMDNPFAQTNAAHLLKPLMDVAKKSSTQLICFTGLGGESIYNSFDNIYVLNLISSNLRKGMQYLKSEHTKGQDIEIMVTSQIKTEEVEQLDFLF